MMRSMLALQPYLLVDTAAGLVASLYRRSTHASHFQMFPSLLSSLLSDALPREYCRKYIPEAFVINLCISATECNRGRPEQALQI